MIYAWGRRSRLLKIIPMEKIRNWLANFCWNLTSCFAIAYVSGSIFYGMLYIQRKIHFMPASKSLFTKPVEKPKLLSLHIHICQFVRILNQWECRVIKQFNTCTLVQPEKTKKQYAVRFNIESLLKLIVQYKMQTFHYCLVLPPAPIQSFVMNVHWRVSNTIYTRGGAVARAGASAIWESMPHRCTDAGVISIRRRCCITRIGTREGMANKVVIHRWWGILRVKREETWQRSVHVWWWWWCWRLAWWSWRQECWRTRINPRRVHWSEWHCCITYAAWRLMKPSMWNWLATAKITHILINKET